MKNYITPLSFIQKKQKPNHKSVFVRIKIAIALLLLVASSHVVYSNKSIKTEDRCGVQITIIGESQKSLIETPVIYQLQIKNTGVNIDKYVILVEDYVGFDKNPDGSDSNNNITSGFLLFDSNNIPVNESIVLSPGETKILNLRIVFPAELKYGSWNIKKIKVISKSCPDIFSEIRVNTLVPALEIDKGDGTGYLVPANTEYLLGNLSRFYCLLFSKNQQLSYNNSI